ncbi:hypothetical protein HZQ94_10370 [Elizabethkingia anophelis]|uniref:hypothetical protein n=1 Tax=Elizabethkingia anophelis TaxID=1117645 RepID=UPI0021A26CC2|nr:hypothetical protein [Elizabethkingia anophelis]MCT3680837.1 hypothetical protein [Elizabethkingia anophelis]
MQIILSDRNTGKTNQLIKLSAVTGNYIVCSTKHQAGNLHMIAKNIGYNIPLPITYDEFIRREYYSQGIRGFLIDDAELFLQSLSHVPINVITLTNTPPNSKDFPQILEHKRNIYKFSLGAKEVIIKQGQSPRGLRFDYKRPDKLTIDCQHTFNSQELNNYIGWLVELERALSWQ